MAEFTALPKCYDDRETFDEKTSYVFISYAHLDAETVYGALEVLYDNCLNFWYDKKLLQGECWDKSVADRLRADNCAGIVMFLSKNSIKSDAVGKELKLYKEIREKRPDFMLFPIILNGGTVNSTVRDAYLSCEALSAADLDRMMPQERVAEFLQTIPSNFFYFRYDADGNYLNGLLERLKILDGDLEDVVLFCSNDSVLAELKRLDCFVEENDVDMLEFGNYPQSKDTTATINKYKDGCRTMGTKKYTVLKENVYVHSPLKWQVIKNDSAYLTAITTCAVDAARLSELDKLLHAEFLMTAFTDVEREAVVSVDVADIAYLEDIVKEEEPMRTAYAKAKNRSGGILTTYWAKCGDDYAEFFVDGNSIVINDAPGPNEDRIAFLQISAVFDINKFMQLNK